MSKFIGAFIALCLGLVVTVVTLLSVGAAYGFVLLLLFGILHLHVFYSLPAIGWWTAWPLGVIWQILLGSKLQDNISASIKKEK